MSPFLLLNYLSPVSDVLVVAASDIESDNSMSKSLLNKRSSFTECFGRLVEGLLRGGEPLLVLPFCVMTISFFGLGFGCVVSALCLFCLQLHIFTLLWHCQ